MISFHQEGVFELLFGIIIKKNDINKIYRYFFYILLINLLFHPDNLLVKMSFVSFRKSRASKLRQMQRRNKGKKPGSKRGENLGKPWKRKTWKKP